MIKVRQVIIVEGKYDKARLASLVDADILMTGGFDIFRDKKMLDMIRRLAKTRGIAILTDSDAAGFRIRSYITGAVEAAQITHVYIPDLPGKERRKAQPGAEGKLGVEGIPSALLLEAFARAGITAEQAPDLPADASITHTDFLEWGLSGGENSAVMRRRVLHKLGLPARMNVKSMLEIVNSLYNRESFIQILETL